MTPTPPTRLELDLIDLMATNIGAFLLLERRRGNEGWFTVADIADHVGPRPPLIPFIRALKDVAATGYVEGDDEGRVRHI